MSNRKIFGPVEYALLGGIVLFTLSGVVLLGVTGIAPIPGLPVLFADQPEPSPTKVTAKPSAIPSASPDEPIVSSSPEVSPVATASPSPSPTTSPDQQRIERLTEIKAALDLRAKTVKSGSKYPVSETYTKGNTAASSSPLQVLVPDYLPNGLPVDPESPTEFFGYKSDGQTYELTAKIKDTSNPAGEFVGNLYLYILRNP